jgi:hypothetical protein
MPAWMPPFPPQSGRQQAIQRGDRPAAASPDYRRQSSVFAKTWASENPFARKKFKLLRPMLSKILIILMFSFATVYQNPTGSGTRAGSAKRHDVILDEFRRRTEECRRLAASARNAADRTFWMGLAERWQALETQTAERPRREKPKTSRRHPELSTAVDFD